MKLFDAIADCLNHIRRDRGASKATCEHHASWLHHFADWLTKNGYRGADLETVSATAGTIACSQLPAPGNCT